MNIDTNINLGEILEHIPAVVCRSKLRGNTWTTQFITNNISMYGYSKTDFLDGTIDWFDIIHPDDRVLTLKNLKDYARNNMNQFRVYYRLLTATGESVAVTEYYTANRNDSGEVDSYDTVILSNRLSLANSVLIDNHYKQQVILNDILLSLQDSDLNQALQIILDRTGEYLDTSRVLLFKDSADHKTCKVVYEWDNRGS